VVSCAISGSRSVTAISGYCRDCPTRTKFRPYSRAYSFSYKRPRGGRPTPRFTAPPNYSFPHHRLNLLQRYPERKLIALVRIWIFQSSDLPPSAYVQNGHRLCIRLSTDFEVSSGYMRPVSDKYEKPGLLIIIGESSCFVYVQILGLSSWDCIRVHREGEGVGRGAVALYYGKSMRPIVMVHLRPIFLWPTHTNRSTRPVDHQFLRVSMCTLATERTSQ
jgi:hypothetical protein